MGSRFTGSATAMATGTSGSMMPLGTFSGGGGSEKELILGGAKEGFFSGFSVAETADDEGNGGRAFCREFNSHILHNFDYFEYE